MQLFCIAFLVSLNVRSVDISASMLIEGQSLRLTFWCCCEFLLCGTQELSVPKPPIANASLVTFVRVRAQEWQGLLSAVKLQTFALERTEKRNFPSRLHLQAHLLSPHRSCASLMTSQLLWDGHPGDFSQHFY